jgi:hypothetical protein
MNRILKFAAAGLIACVGFTGCNDDDDIIGLNDAAKYGYIKVTIEGTLPDGEEYDVTKNFRFAPSTAPAYGSSAWIYSDTYKEFYVSRFFGAINESNEGEDNMVELRWYVSDEEGEENFVESGLYLETSIITDDKKFFILSENFYIENNDQVTSYKYNEETGKLSVKFTANGFDNFGNDVVITVNANVTVFKSMNINL